ncbi:hypothetical protein BDL97_01G155700 [Sphagnum fallax]|nr:hypothetical protein BDL97_01G155700 [Sphagnum fallax]
MHDSGANRSVQEIDQLVEQQRLQRLERQKCEESDAAAQQLAQEAATSISSLHQAQQSDGKLCKVLCKQLLVPSRTCMDSDPKKPVGCKDEAGGGAWRGGGKEAQRAKQAQQQSMRAVVESRRRLARGPRSGVVVPDHAHAARIMLPSEDHRVVSTEYQAAGTQALMRVTLLAAGFVIGARGISARLIGQVTGAIVQSWTESCRPDSVPIRLFRIQGKKAVVQTAVALIEQAVAKYKDLCECKRRGEFVQREHIINGVEFYYQPPPRKAFALAAAAAAAAADGQSAGCCTQMVGDVGAAAAAAAHVVVGQATNATGTAQQLPFSPHHVWLQHLQQQQQQQQAQAAPQQHQQNSQAIIHESTQGQLMKASGVQVLDCHSQNHHRSLVRQQHAGLFDWQSQQTQVQQQHHQVNAHCKSNVESERGDHEQHCAAAEFELIDQGLQQSVASLEQALHQVRLEQRLLQQQQHNSNNRGGVVVVESSTERSYNNSCKQNDCNNSLWSDVTQDMGRSNNNNSAPPSSFSSLFSIFGNGGLPLPISQNGGQTSDVPPSSNNVGLLNSSSTTSTTAFDFPRCDFLRESLTPFPFATRQGGLQVAPEYSLYHGSPTPLPPSKIDSDDSLCVVCLDRPAGVRIVTCGHTSFCFSCVQGLVNCPLCHEQIVGLHHMRQLHGSGAAAATALAVSSSSSPAVGAPTTHRGSSGTSGVAAKMNGSSTYHLWNWVPGASV